MNDYLTALEYLDTIFDLQQTANLVIIVWVVGKGLYKLWKIVA